MSLATATTAILAMSVLQISVLIGLGLLLVSLSQTESGGSKDLLMYVWPGLAVVFAALQLWHCFWPIDWRISALLGTGGLYGLATNRDRARGALISAWNQYGWAGFCFSAAFLLWTAQLMLRPADTLDNGNYHLPSILWSATYPIVKGIGNIDGHYAFNSVTFLHHAALEIGFWRGKSQHIASGPLLMVLFLQLFATAHELLRKRGPSHKTGLAPLFLLTPLLYVMSMNGGDFRPSSPGTDLPVTVLMFVMATLLWDLSRAAVSPDIAGKNRIPGIVFIIACAAGAAAVVKASSWIFVFASLAMGMIVLLRAQEIAWASRRNAALASGSVVAIMLGTWIWRSVQLSGYPFFPSTFLPLPVPWRIPIEYASWSGWWISAFARGTSDVSQNTGEQMVLIPAWFSAQWRVFKIEVVLPLALMGATAATYLFASPPRRASFRGALAATRLAILPTAVSLAFWYVTAPSVRFGAALLWIAAAMAASAGLHLVLEERAQRRAIFAVLALPVLCAGQHIVVAAKETHTSIAQAAGPVLFVPCGAGNCFYPPPSSQLEKITTRSGLTAYTPAARNCGDREYIKCLIWNAPLPAAGLIRPTLAYLDPNRPTVGFVTQERAGEWLQLFGDEIRAAHATQHLGIQELANRFRVHPRYIRQALGIP